MKLERIKNTLSLSLVFYLVLFLSIIASADVLFGKAITWLSTSSYPNPKAQSS